LKGLLQRVDSASVSINEKIVSKIGRGILLFLAVENDDNDDDLNYMIKKTSTLRIFNDKFGKINLSIKDVSGEVLIVSQFTLSANIKKGRRPSFVGSAEPLKAKSYYDLFCFYLKNEGVSVKTGVFGADMLVNLQNNGPFTIFIDSVNRK
tara:strand:- start:3247 stop:3696 length:450 start_codon:yes stop_codon:yes gene_type:complete